MANIFFYKVNTVNMGNMLQQKSQKKGKLFSKHVNTVNTSQHSINMKQHLSTLSSVVHNLSQKPYIFFCNVNTVNTGNMLQQTSQNKEKLFSKHVNTVNTSQHSINLKQHISTLSSVVNNLSQKANIFFYNVNTVNMGNMLQQNS